MPGLMGSTVPRKSSTPSKGTTAPGKTAAKRAPANGKDASGRRKRATPGKDGTALEAQLRDREADATGGQDRDALAHAPEADVERALPRRGARPRSTCRLTSG